MPRVIPIQSGRTRFADDIAAEFWIPRKPSHKAIILCDGCPSVPSKRKLAEFFARKGYWVFHPRYRGSWESGGEFLRYAPHEDVLLVAENINKGFRNVYDQMIYFLDIHEIIVAGVSFGGTAAALASMSPLVTKAIAIAPVIDWCAQAKSEDEPFDEFLRINEEGFGNAYRAPRKNYRKLLTGKFYNPISSAQKINSKKLFIIHAKDDRVVGVVPLKKFAKQTKIPILILPHGGHLSSTIVMKPEIWKRLALFVKKSS